MMQPRGFIALISAILLSFSLLAIGTAVSDQSLRARRDELHTEQRLMAREAALGCIEYLRLACMRDALCAGSETIGSCSISAVAHQDGAYLAIVSANEGTAFASFAVALDDATFNALAIYPDVPP